MPNIRNKGITNKDAGRGLTTAVEVIEQLVKAWSDGTLPKPITSPLARLSELRFAPSFQPGIDNGGIAYTEQNVFDTLGIVGDPSYVRAAIKLCELFETHPELREEVMRQIAKGKRDFRPRALLKMFQ